MKKRDAVKFTFVLSGEGEFEKKLIDSLQNNPSKSQDVVMALGSVLMLAFGWTKADGVSFDHFKAGKVEPKTEKSGTPA